MFMSYNSRSASRVIVSTIIVATVFMGDSVAFAANTWNPTLLVNTQAHQTIEEGNGSSNIELRFGGVLNEKLYFDRANNRFTFSNSLRVNGNISATGSMSGASLNVNGAAVVGGTTTLNGATTVNANVKVRGNLSGSTLRVDGAASVGGALSATGALRSGSDITINSDNDTNDASLTFGNQTAAQTLKYSNANQRFEFSKDIRVTGGVRASGNLSGSTLTVDGALNLRGINYNAPTAQGASNTYLRNDGAGNLSWQTTGSANGSGGSLSLHPQYPNAVYTQSGSSAVGTLTQGADTTNKELFYRWATEETAIQDYWTWVRVKVPKNFSNWTPTPIQFRYRTASTSAAVNYLNIRLLDTTGANVAITGGSNLVSSVADTWATATLGNVASGTYTPDGFITILIKTATTSAGSADAGYLNINWSTTTP